MTTPNFPGKTALLDTTERLIYAGGIHATGMDAIVKASGVARKTLYGHYPTKEALVVAALTRRDERWMQWFITATSHQHDPDARLLSVFTALHEWFQSKTFHGCAFLNAAGEIGDPANDIRGVARMHKERLLSYLVELTTMRGQRKPERLAMQFLLLIDGAISAALVFDNPDAAVDAGVAARVLLEAS